jgi:hypothetical protein
MTAISIFCESIRQWLNFDGYSDELITSWVRMAETTVSTTLRCKHQISIVSASIADRRSKLPDKWSELDFVAGLNGGVYDYMSREGFFSKNCPPNRYTITGNYIYIGGPITDGTSVELSFYEEIPALNQVPTWFSLRYPVLAVQATLAVSYMYSQEPDKAAETANLVNSLISAINDEHTRSKASGSIIKIPHRRKPF